MNSCTLLICILYISEFVCLFACFSPSLSELLFVTFRKQLIELLKHNDELFISTVGFPLSLTIPVFKFHMKAAGGNSNWFIFTKKQSKNKSACLPVFVCVMNNNIELKKCLETNSSNRNW